jgi:hypothetical protein
MSIPLIKMRAPDTLLCLFLCFPLFTLTGCSSTESDFIEALSTNDNSEVCIGLAKLGLAAYGEGQNIVIAESNNHFTKLKGINLIPTLKEKQYLSATAEAIRVQGSFVPVTAYKVTEKGLPVFKDGLCIGNRTNFEIIEYTETEGQPTRVTFKYGFEFSDIARELGLKDALLNAKSLDLTNDKAMAVFSKTNKGWHLETAMW